MANKEHLNILKQGVEAWNKWRDGKRLKVPDLFEAALSNANLSKADLVGADLRVANLEGANLSGTNLTGADLSRANFSQANLQRSTLMLANLSRVNLRGADLSKATLALTTLGEIDLSSTTGLDTVHHLAPSTVGTDTLYLSRGRISEVFLRGCGLPDEMIGFARSIAGSPIESNSCFISYSTKDENFAKRLYGDLQANGVRCWFAPHDMQGGKKLHDQIDWAIHFHDRTLLILSPDSINSHWVKTEIGKARMREIKEKRQVLFPIRLVDFKTLLKWEYFDADSGTDYAKEIREYFIPDFSNWSDPTSYRTAFQRLLKDLSGDKGKEVIPKQNESVVPKE